MSASMQRQRWADLVDSSDDEMESPDSWPSQPSAASIHATESEAGIRIDVGAIVHPRSDRSRRCTSPLGRRRSVRMPIFTKQPPLTPSIKPQMSRESGGGQERKHSVGDSQQSWSIAAPEEGCDRHFAKREAEIEIAKSMPEYQALMRIRQRESSLGVHPPTPDPADETISKRRWEAEVAIWRTATRERFQSS